MSLRGISCSQCGHTAILTAGLQERMNRFSSPIYKMRCKQCGAKNAVYNENPRNGYLGSDEVEQNQREFEKRQAWLEADGIDADAYEVLPPLGIDGKIDG